MKTFEHFLAENVEKGIIDFSIRAMYEDKYTIRFYIHALGHDSDTLDFMVDENVLIPINLTDTVRRVDSDDDAG